MAQVGRSSHDWIRRGRVRRCVPGGPSLPLGGSPTASTVLRAPWARHIRAEARPCARRACHRSSQQFRAFRVSQAEGTEAQGVRELSHRDSQRDRI